MCYKNSKCSFIRAVNVFIQHPPYEFTSAPHDIAFLRYVLHRKRGINASTKDVLDAYLCYARVADAEKPSRRAKKKTVAKTKPEKPKPKPAPKSKEDNVVIFPAADRDNLVDRVWRD
jgi:hypothetical protein